jgi:hypothetical protein
MNSAMNHVVKRRSAMLVRLGGSDQMTAKLTPPSKWLPTG